MSKLSKQQQAAIEAVATHFSATWESAAGVSPDAYLTVRGKRIAADVAVLKHKSAGKPRLRFDKSVLRLIGGVQAALAKWVPDGTAVMFAVTAPIKLRAKTAEALEIQIRDALSRRAAKVEIEDTICGNEVRIRIVKRLLKDAPTVIGFVHNPDTNAAALLDTTQSLLEVIGAAADKRPPKSFTGERWLVIADDAGASYLDVYRHVWSQLSPGFRKILIVSAGNRVETILG
ncbi:MAG: hypothetical protein ABSD74_02400 [Rhizomicrobium sp.]